MASQTQQQQQLTEILNVISHHQSNFSQIEAQLNSVTNFLKQQFGGAFLTQHYCLDDPSGDGHGLGNLPDNPKPVHASVEHHHHKKHCTIIKLEPTDHELDLPAELSDYEDSNSSPRPSPAAEFRTAGTGTNGDHPDESDFPVEDVQPINIIHDRQKLIGIARKQVVTVKIERMKLPPLPTLPPCYIVKNDFNDYLEDDFTNENAVSSHSSISITECQNSQSNISIGSTTPSTMTSVRTAATAAAGTTRKFKCNWPNCNVNFSHRTSLTRHRRAHTGEKPFICTWPDCNKSFRDSSTFIRHKRIHTNEKPFKCNWPNCGQQFRHSGNLIKHQNCHKNNGKKYFRCDFPKCWKRFRSLIKLGIHTKQIHHPDDITRMGMGNSPFEQEDAPPPELEPSSGSQIPIISNCVASLFTTGSRRIYTSDLNLL